MRRVGTVIASVSRKAGGLFESVRNLTFAVVEQARFDNLVFSMRDEYTDSDRAAWSPLETKVCDVRGPKAFGFAPDLYRSLAEGNVDIIHNHGIWMYPSMVVAKLARDSSIPYIVSPHGMLDPWAVSHSRWKKTVARTVYEGRHLRGAACLRALCESEAIAMRSFGLKNRICIIPNGIHLPDADPVPLPAWNRAIPEGRKVLLYLGRIHPKKGLQSLVEAWAQLVQKRARRLDEWQLVIAGWEQAHHERELKSLAQSLGLERSITFVGPQFGGDRAGAYARAGAFVLPSLGEGMPMVVLEAWSYGLPVIMTPECNLTDGFDAGAAIRIDSQPKAIAAGIESLFSLTDQQRNAIGSAGRRLVEARYQWSRIGTEMAGLYEWLIGGGSPPPALWH